MLKKLGSVYKQKSYLKTPSGRNCNIATVKWCDCLRGDVSGVVLVSFRKGLVYPELCVPERFWSHQNSLFKVSISVICMVEIILYVSNKKGVAYRLTLLLLKIREM